MSEPTTTKATSAASANGRAGASDDSVNIKAGEAAAKQAEAMGLGAEATAAPKKKAAPRKAAAKAKPAAAETTAFAFPQAEDFFQSFQSFQAFKFDNTEMFDRFRDAAAEAFDRFETSNATFLGAATEVQRRSFDFMQSQLDNHAALVKALGEVENPAEAFKLQQDYMANAFKAATEQANELQTLVTDATKDGMSSYTEVLEKMKTFSSK